MKSRRAVSAVLSTILLILIVVIGMTVALAFFVNYVRDYQAGSGSSALEAAEIEDVWFRSAASSNPPPRNPSSYLIPGTTWLPVTANALTTSNDINMTFSSYASAFSPRVYTPVGAALPGGTGAHSNFTAQQYLNESYNDTLTEAQNGVYNNTENSIDAALSGGSGTHSTFSNQQAKDNNNDTLTEANTGWQKNNASSYSLLGSTGYVSGSLTDLQTDNGAYMQFRSYISAYSGTSTFGYSTIGGSSASIENYIRGSLFSVPYGGQAQSISAYIDLTSGAQTFGDTSTESSTASIEDTIRGALFAPSYGGVATSITAYVDLGSMTFGDTSPESSYSSGSIMNSIRGSSFTCSESGTIQGITAYVYCTTVAKNMKAAIYNNDASHSFVAETEEKSVATGSTWVTFNFATPQSVTSGNSYVLVVWSASGSGGNAYLYYHSGSSNQGHSQSLTYGSWPSPASFSQNSYEYSIYCTYTPRTVKAAIYSDAHALVASTGETTVSADGWVTLNLLSPQTLTAGTNYILAAWSNSAGGSVSMRYYTYGSTNQGHSQSQTYGSWPSSLGSVSHNNWEYSIYCTYQPSAKVKAAIYSDAHAFIGSTEEKTVATDGWVTFNLLSPQTLTAGTNYILVAWSNSAGGVNMPYTSGASNQGHYDSETYGSWPSSASFSHESRQYSIYCTYTTASEYTCEAEFMGTSNAQSWPQLIWTIDSNCTADGVTATFQLWNYQTGQYPTSGDGYVTDTIGTGGKTEIQTITAHPTDFRDTSGNWKLKVKYVKATNSSLDCKIDLIEYKVGADNFELELQEQWTTAGYETYEELCVYTGPLSSENLYVDVWTGSTWVTVATLGSADSNNWINVTVSSYLSSSTFTIRFKGSIETNDPTQSSWQIDCVLLHVWSPNYQLDLQEQWTNADYYETDEYLYIYTGILDSERLDVDVWNGSSWKSVFNQTYPLKPNQLNNVSVSQYLTSSTFTIRFKGSTETGDNVQSSWNVDCVQLYTGNTPMKYASEVDFTGSSEKLDWTSLNWTVECASTVDSASVTLQLYDYSAQQFATSGDGYISYISGAAKQDQIKYQNITANLARFFGDDGNWTLKIRQEKTTPVTQFNCTIDWIELRVATRANGVRLSLYNYGKIDLTVNSVYVNDLKVESNPLEVHIDEHGILTFFFPNMWTPNTTYHIKLVTERGVVFEGDFVSPNATQ